jgi:hypothetical protein
MDWVASLEAADISFSSKVEVTLARPSLLRKVSNNPFLGKTDSVKTFYQVNDLPTIMDGDNSDNHDAVIVDTTDAGGLEGSPAGAV